MVPSDWRRFQLSELINKVLENDQAVPFDFLVGDELLRTSLGNYTQSKGLTEETILELEYVESILPPQYLSSFKHEDWISDVDVSQPGRFLTSAYDNNVRIFSSSRGLQQSLIGHTLPVLSTCWLTPSKNFDCIASGGMDRVIRVWQVGKGDNEEESRGTHALALHTSPVSSVRSLASASTTSDTQKKLISAGWDGLVGYWDFSISQTEDASGDEGEEAPKTKRRRRANGDSTTGDKITKVRPALVLRSHQGQVSRALLDAGTNGKKAYSFGLDDHAVREWDLEAGGTETSTKQSDKAIMDADQLASPNLLVTGNGDRTVTLFDMREENSIISLSLSGHSSSVAAVSANPNSPFLFCSAAYDSTVRIWDARSPKQALFAMKSQHAKQGKAGGKLLCTAWDGSMIASGGEDGELELMQSKGN